MKLKLYLFDLSKIVPRCREVVMPSAQFLEYFYDAISKVKVGQGLKITDFLAQIFKKMNKIKNVGPLTKVEFEICQINEIILSGYNRA